MLYDSGGVTHDNTVGRNAMGHYTIRSNDGVPANNQVTAIADDCRAMADPATRLNSYRPSGGGALAVDWNVDVIEGAGMIRDYHGIRQDHIAFQMNVVLDRYRGS